MTITEKIDNLKTYVDWDFSKFNRETLVFPYDFKKAVEYALRKINKVVRSTMIDLFVPLVNNQRYYSIDTSILSKRKVDLVSLTGVSFMSSGIDKLITPSTTTSTAGWSYVDLSNAENIYRDNMFDYQALSQFITGKDYGFRLSVTSKQVELGVYDTISALPADNTITLGTSAAIGKVICNLDKAARNEYYQATVGTAGTSPVLDNNVKLTPYNWEVNDKVYVSTGKPTFLVMTFKCMPKYGYFDTETEIPLIASLIDCIDSFAVSYLFAKLIGRDNTQVSANKLNALRLTQIIKTEEQELANVKMLTADAKPTVIKSYLPYSNTPTTYGR